MEMLLSHVERLETSIIQEEAQAHGEERSLYVTEREEENGARAYLQSLALLLRYAKPEEVSSKPLG